MQEKLPRVLIKLIEERRLLCPKNALPLVLSDGHLISEDATWKIKSRSVDLYGDYDSDPISFSDHAFAREVAIALKLEDQLPSVTAAVADTALLAIDPAYTAEIAELADRLGIADRVKHAQEKPLVNNLEANLSFMPPFMGATLPAGSSIKRSLRVKNDGQFAVSSEGHSPVHISYHWLDLAGNPVIFEGERSPLPIPLTPGSSVTVICDIITPAMPGKYLFQFQALIEGIRWIEDAIFSIPILVEHEFSRQSPLEYTINNYSYQEDHTLSLYLAEHMLNAIPGSKRLLEVGGGIHPQSNALTRSNCDVVSIDISSPMSQLGQLYFDHVDRNERIAFVTCDAHAPPFQAETFDGVMIFSALHHFADPVRLLTNLKRVLKPHGFIATMCEPCEPNREDPMYIRDLEKGINEQIWTVDEYEEIFNLAGLTIKSGRVDGGSLKAILVPN